MSFKNFMGISAVTSWDVGIMPLLIGSEDGSAAAPEGVRGEGVDIRTYMGNIPFFIQTWQHVLYKAGFWRILSNIMFRRSYNNLLQAFRWCFFFRSFGLQASWLFFLNKSVALKENQLEVCIQWLSSLKLTARPENWWYRRWISLWPIFRGVCCHLTLYRECI